MGEGNPGQAGFPCLRFPLRPPLHLDHCEKSVVACASFSAFVRRAPSARPAQVLHKILPKQDSHEFSYRYIFYCRSACSKAAPIAQAASR
jgi:hypothetical protein